MFSGYLVTQCLRVIFVIPTPISVTGELVSQGTIRDCALTSSFSLYRMGRNADNYVQSDVGGNALSADCLRYVFTPHLLRVEGKYE